MHHIHIDPKDEKKGTQLDRFNTLLLLFLILLASEMGLFAFFVSHLRIYGEHFMNWNKIDYILQLLYRLVGSFVCVFRTEMSATKWLWQKTDWKVFCII